MVADDPSAGPYGRKFWNEAYREDPDGVAVPDRVIVAEIAGLAPGRALDLGCGDGRNALMLARRGWRVLGVDWAEEAVELASAAATAEDVDASFVVGDVTCWDPPHRFELVVSTFALPVPGPALTAALATAASAVAPGGTLLIAEWNRTMAGPWGFRPSELPAVDDIVAGLWGLDVASAEVRTVGAVGEPGEPRHLDDRGADVIVVRATRPR